MSLKHALLGLLNYTEMSGYEIKQFFDDSISHFWNAKLSQIYPTLNQMKEDGLLNMEVKQQENLPNAKIYSLTEKGKEELLSWLQEPIGLTQYREAFLIKVFFGALLDKEVLKKQVSEQLKLHEERLEHYQEELAELMSMEPCLPDFEHERSYWLLTLDLGIKTEEAYISWCRETIEKIGGEEV